MEKVVVVLRGGGDYQPQHVYRLKKMVEEHWGSEFVCLSDQALQCNYLPLVHNWPGWWSKMELFRLRPPFLFLDLDTTILGPVTFQPTMQQSPFMILRDVYRGKRNQMAMQSSIMWINQDMTWVYEKYRENPVFKKQGGDQAWLEEHLKADYFQDITDEIVSFKADVQRRGLKDSDQIVIFHGQPRPWEQSLL